MRPQQLEQFLTFGINNKLPILIKGKPGIGKSDIVAKASSVAGAKLILSHPVVSDPTDYKGLPYQENGKAKFLPFSDLEELINAQGPTVFFLDDLGQAPAAVQAACMQLILARQINGHIISPDVTFVAATNRKEDKAGVNGILEPVKSRFASIVELEVSVQDWTKWANQNGMPIDLISFVRFRPELLDNGTPSKDIVNSPCPRTIAAVGKMQNAGLPQGLEFEAFKGAAGEAFAAEYTAFLQIARSLPSVEQILLNPTGTEVPEDPAAKYALCGALSVRANDVTTGSIISYMTRVGDEFTVACLQDAVIRNPKVGRCRAFTDWSVKNADVLFDLN